MWKEIVCPHCENKLEIYITTEKIKTYECPHCYFRYIIDESGRTTGPADVLMTRYSCRCKCGWSGYDHQLDIEEIGDSGKEIGLCPKCGAYDADMDIGWNSQ